MRAGAAEAERVAVGRGLRDLARRDRAARAALVLDHDLLAERPAHLLGDDARHHVVAAAGGVGNDQGDRPRRIVLRRRAGRREQRETEARRHNLFTLHPRRFCVADQHSKTKPPASSEPAVVFRQNAIPLPRPRRGADNRCRVAERTSVRSRSRRASSGRSHPSHATCDASVLRSSRRRPKGAPGVSEFGLQRLVLSFQFRKMRLDGHRGSLLCQIPDLNILTEATRQVDGTFVVRRVKSP